MPEYKQYTRSEVEAGSGKDKTLLILHDKVYDVTSFLNEHPGGEEILLDHAGKDGSDDFDDVGHSKDAFELMKNYRVGEIVEAERTNKSPKQSWNSLYSKSQNDDSQSGLSVYLVVAALAVAIAVFYVYL